MKERGTTTDDRPPPHGCDAEGRTKPKVQFTCARDLTPTPIDWLWDGYIAAGKLSLLAGAPGTGKTTIALKIAATITTGGFWPDDARAPLGNVVIWSGEDDPNDTLVPRLILARADLSRVHFVSGVTQTGSQRAFDPSSDTAALRAAISKLGNVKLLIIDPIVSAITGDSHKNAEVRRSLQPLADLTASAGCALLGITHFSKGSAGRDPVERLNGSLAFGALARTVLVASKQQNATSDLRLFVRAKSNIGPDGGGFEYKLQQRPLRDQPTIIASTVEWRSPLKGTARDLLAVAETVQNNDRRHELLAAKQFLTELLSKGPVESKQVKADAQGAGHTWATVRRAQKELGIKPRKGGMNEGWLWKLPRSCSTAPEAAQANGVSTFDMFEHLQHETTRNEAAEQ